MAELPPSVVTLYGRTGTLKTTAGLGWPKRLHLFDFDLGSHRGWGIRAMQTANQVVVQRMDSLPKRSLTAKYEKLGGFMAAWGQFQDDYHEQLESKDTITVQIDTGSVLWELVRDAYLEELQQVPPPPGKGPRKQLSQMEYGEPNRRMRRLISDARSYQKHLILVHHEGEEYAPVLFDGKPVTDEEGRPRSAPTGQKVPEGFKRTPELSDWILYFTMIDHEPAAIVQKSALGIDLVGMKLTWVREKSTVYDELLKRLVVMERL